MKKLTKILLLAALLTATVAMLAACGNKATAKSITIYSTAEDYRNEHARSRNMTSIWLILAPERWPPNWPPRARKLTLILLWSWKARIWKR